MLPPSQNYCVLSFHTAFVEVTTLDFVRDWSQVYWSVLFENQGLYLPLMMQISQMIVISVIHSSFLLCHLFYCLSISLSNKAFIKHYVYTDLNWETFLLPLFSFLYIYFYVYFFHLAFIIVLKSRYNSLPKNTYHNKQEYKKIKSEKPIKSVK